MDPRSQLSIYQSLTQREQLNTKDHYSKAITTTIKCIQFTRKKTWWPIVQWKYSYRTSSWSSSWFHFFKEHSKESVHLCPTHTCLDMYMNTYLHIFLHECTDIKSMRWLHGVSGSDSRPRPCDTVTSMSHTHTLFLSCLSPHGGGYESQVPFWKDPSHNQWQADWKHCCHVPDARLVPLHLNCGMEDTWKENQVFVVQSKTASIILSLSSDKSFVCFCYVVLLCIWHTHLSIVTYARFKPQSTLENQHSTSIPNPYTKLLYE